MKLTVFFIIFLIANTVGNDESIDSESSENSDLPSFDNNDLAGESRDSPEYCSRILPKWIDGLTCKSKYSV